MWSNGVSVGKCVRVIKLHLVDLRLQCKDPREDAGGLSREYILRIPSVSEKATKGAPLYSYSRWYGVKQ